MREKLRQEIVNIPDSRLREIYDVIHFFRLGLTQTSQQNQSTTTPDIMRFAGAWEDMHDFDAFENEIAQRRRTAFKSRRSDEAGPD